MSGDVIERMAEEIDENLGFVPDTDNLDPKSIRWAAEASTASFKTMVDALPEDCNWAGFGTSAMEMPMVAQAVLLGGNIRVGLEDNLYLEKGVFASNGQLVERACDIVELMGCSIQTPSEARETLGLKKA